MANIAIICEGISESNILKHVITKYSGIHSLNIIQPKLTANGNKQDGFGGWQQVLEHCTDDTFDNIFQFNDYLVIQIDTDASHMPHYEVPHTHPDGSAKSATRLHAEIKSRLIHNISRSKRKQYLPRIIFAICHNEIECWLLPIYYTDNNACRNHNCIFTINTALDRKNISKIPNKDKNCSEAQKTYRAILKNLRNKAAIVNCAKRHLGFELFLQGLNIIPEPQA